MKLGRLLPLPVRQWGLHSAAFLWRRLMFRTTFIAITGSVGKTTTKELLADILARHAPTLRTFANRNDSWGVPQTILQVRPRHRFAVIEVATRTPGVMHRLARLVKPDIAVVLAVLHVHRKGLRTIEAVAAEKQCLPAALRRGGVAILNADDPFVSRMKTPLGVRVRRFGTHTDADCVATGARATWPQRLALRASLSGETLDVATQLVGDCWTPSILAAVLTAETCGIPLRDSVSRIETTEPYTGRLQPVALLGGAIILRDDKGAQAPTMEVALRILRDASVERRVLVVSDYSDTSRSHQDRMKFLGRHAARCADVAVFIDSRGEKACRSAVRAGMRGEDVHHFVALPEAADFLRSELRRGDLVLLKGRIGHHLARLYFAQLGTIACWKVVCRKQSLCDLCPQLGATASLAAGVPSIHRPNSDGSTNRGVSAPD